MLRKSTRKGFVSSRLGSKIEALEDRVLFAANVWKAAVSGNWNDATKWSLGHVPTTSEDVQINVAGNYTVSLDATKASYYYANTLKVGGATGTQALKIDGNGVLYVNKTFNVAAGDKVDIFTGRFVNYSVAGTTNQLDGTIGMNGAYGKSSYLTVGAAAINGTGSIVLNTGGAYATSANYFNATGATLNSGITLRGKGGYIGGKLINKGTIKLESASTDVWQFNVLDNQGTFTATGGANVQIYDLKNAAGKTISVSGGTLDLRGSTYSNLGTISAINAKLFYGMTFTSTGNVVRTGSTVYFSGTLDGQGKAFVTGDSLGQWVWQGGTLYNGQYDGTSAKALKQDPSTTNGTYGVLRKVTLTGDLNIRGGFYVSVYEGLTLGSPAGKPAAKIILNGNATQGRAAVYAYTSTIGGVGEIVFNTAGNNTSYNLINGNTWTLGSGVTIRGKSGVVGGGFTNAGTILADSGNETIHIYDVVNNGNIIAAPGKVKIDRYTGGAGGALTVGVGGTTAGSSYGQFNFASASYAPALNGTINVVTLNGYAPAAGATFTAATFAKAPTGVFVTKNLDSGNGRAFDLTQTTTSLSVKAKTVAGPFASRSGTGALTITGTTAADTIVGKSSLGVVYATVNGKTSVFYDRQITGVTVNAGDGNDTVTVSGRGATLNGGNGNDSLTGGASDDVLDGGSGSDLLSGGLGADRYVFGDGGTVAETDLINEAAGGGTDTLDFSTATKVVTIKLNSDTLATVFNRTIKTKNAGSFNEIENAVGGAAADNITGNNAANKLTGGTGADKIDGGAGNDSLYGGAGNDSLTGGAGADSLFGENDNDTLYGAGDNTKDILDGGVGTDVKGSADVIDTLVSVP